MPARIIHGAIVTPCTTRSADFLPNALICVGDNGVIEWVEREVADEPQLQEVLRSRGVEHLHVSRLRKGEFLLPGFIDTHTHAPQFLNLGIGGQEQLLDWLKNFTYPAESKFGDEHFAKKVYSSVVRRILDFGTTTCCYFGTTHLVGDKALVDVVNATGQRAFIGKCNMNREAPKELLDCSVEESIETTRSLISYIRSLNAPLLAPIVTPRFAIACTDDLLKALGNLAAEDICCSGTAHHHHRHHHPRLPIQTHIAENVAEVRQTAEMFCHSSSYAGVYDDFGLLGPTTILAHGVHLTHEEVTLIKKREAGISHCPTSNFNLSSGVAKVGEWIDRGVKVGLGTDVSGGFSPSMLTAIRDASLASKVLASQVASSPAPDIAPPSSPPAGTLVAKQSLANKALPMATLLYLATLGGAHLCNLEAYTGSLAPGKVFDALLVNVRPDAGNPGVWWDDEDDKEGEQDIKERTAQLQEFVERLFFCGDDRNISAVWVEGKLVGGRQFHLDKAAP